MKYLCLCASAKHKIVGGICVYLGDCGLAILNNFLSHFKLLTSIIELANKIGNNMRSCGQ